MVQGAPDLIQRAAARLGKTSAEDAAPVSGTRALENNRPIAAAPPSEMRLTQKSVVVSPTSLAAHGIGLPGSGPSRTIEEFRSIKRHFLSNALRAQRTSNLAANRIVLITSARPGDGKTFVSVNLALALAYEKDTRVLLLDADAYRQSLLEFLGISAEAGWLDLVCDGSVNARRSILQTNIANLSVLPAGRKRAEIPELMSSRHMKDLLDELLREDPGRYIIIDSLPCLTSTEPAILAALAGQTLFVVAAHETGREETESSLRLLHASPSVNLILNKAEPVLTHQYKGYGYADGYGD